MKKRTSKFTTIVLLFLSFSTCKNIVYKVEGYDYVSKVILYRDGSFYKYHCSALYPETHYYGNWKQKEDTILLNITKPRVYFLKDTKVSIEELHKRNKDSLYFDIQLLECSYKLNRIMFEEYPKIEFYNDTTTGLAAMKKIPITKFYLRSVACFAGIDYAIKDTTANYFKIKMTAQFEYLKKGNVYTDPPVKYIKKFTKLIPVIYDSAWYYLSLKRKIFFKN